MKSPCEHCPKSGTVHTRCDRYADYRKAIDHINHVRSVETAINAYEVPKLMKNAIAKAAR